VGGGGEGGVNDRAPVRPLAPALLVQRREEDQDQEVRQGQRHRHVLHPVGRYSRCWRRSPGRGRAGPL
jgi:hypothetical protein